MGFGQLIHETYHGKYRKDKHYIKKQAWYDPEGRQSHQRLNYRFLKQFNKIINAEYDGNYSSYRKINRVKQVVFLYKKHMWKCEKDINKNRKENNPFHFFILNVTTKNKKIKRKLYDAPSVSYNIIVNSTSRRVFLNHIRYK